MKQFLIIFSIGLALGAALTFFITKELAEPCDPETIIREIKVPEPYPVPVPVPEPVKIDTSSIWKMAIASIDSAFIKSLVKVDTAEIIRMALSKIDTSEILRDYYSSYHYDQTISDDSTMAVQLHQEISQNRILKQSALFRPLKNSVKIIKVPSATSSIYAGVEGYAGPVAGIGPAVSYTSDKFLVGAGYDLFNRAIMFDAKIKLFSWQ